MKYEVIYKSIEYMHLDIEADSPEEAAEIAEWKDGGEFVSDPKCGGWEFESVVDDTGKVVLR